MSHYALRPRLGALAALACMPVAAIAHAGHGDIAGFGDGVLHVTTGLDHMLAAIAVGISSWNGFAMARFCAQDAARLRADMMTVLGRASPSPLPRLWLN